MKLEQIAMEIANKNGTPYVWEDIMNRLKKGIALPFRLKDDKKTTIVKNSNHLTVEDC